jgi:hypothetical protein
VHECALWFRGSASVLCLHMTSVCVGESMVLVQRVVGGCSSAAQGMQDEGESEAAAGTGQAPKEALCPCSGSCNRVAMGQAGKNGVQSRGAFVASLAVPSEACCAASQGVGATCDIA